MILDFFAEYGGIVSFCLVILSDILFWFRTKVKRNTFSGYEERLSTAIKAIEQFVGLFSQTQTEKDKENKNNGSR